MSKKKTELKIDVEVKGVEEGLLVPSLSRKWAIIFSVFFAVCIGGTVFNLFRITNNLEFPSVKQTDVQKFRDRFANGEFPVSPKSIQTIFLGSPTVMGVADEDVKGWPASVLAKAIPDESVPIPKTAEGISFGRTFRHPTKGLLFLISERKEIVKENFKVRDAWEYLKAAKN